MKKCISAILALALCVSLCAGAFASGEASGGSVEAGGGSSAAYAVDSLGEEGRTVSETETMDSLDVPAGSYIVPADPENQTILLTCDGVGQPLTWIFWDGTFTPAVTDLSLTGDIVLEVLDKYWSYELNNDDPDARKMNGETDLYRAAVFVGADGVDDSRSALSAVTGATVTDESMEGGSVISADSFVNAVIVDEGTYEIKDMTFDLTGPGGNDFIGFGTALFVSGASAVTVENCVFNCAGELRGAICAGSKDKSTPYYIYVKDSVLSVDDTHTEEELALCQALGAGTMYNVPSMLSLTGNARGQNMTGYGMIVYDNCDVSSSSWGVLSVDDPGIVSSREDLENGRYFVYGDSDYDYDGDGNADVWDRMACFGTSVVTLNGTTVTITGESGYGSYSVGNCFNYYEDTTFSVPDYGLILANANASAQFTGCTVDSGRFGVMWHATNRGNVVIEDSHFHTGDAVFLMKSASPTLDVTASVLESDTGVILQCAETDDNGSGQNGTSVTTDTPSIPIEGFDLYTIHYAEEDLAGDEAETAVTLTIPTDCIANFTDMNGDCAMVGDIYNSVTGYNVDRSTRYAAGMNLAVNLTRSEITGVISSSTAYSTSGELETCTFTYNGETYEAKTLTDLSDMGEYRNEATPAVNNGVLLTLSDNSVWNVTGVSYLTVLTVDGTSTINGTVTVDGEATDVTGGGTWTGEIVVTP